MGNRLESEGSVYQIKTGRQAGKWRAELVVGWHGLKKVTRTRTVATKGLAQKALRDLANERDAGGVVNQADRASEWTFGPWCREWLRRHCAERDIEEATANGYLSVIRVWIEPHAGKKRLSMVTARTIKGVMTAMRETKSSKRQAYVVMRGALKLATREGLVRRNVAEDVDPPTIKRVKMAPPMDEDADAIYRAILDEPDEALWFLRLSLGLRQGEALGLEWSDIDADRRSIHVHQQLRRRRGQHGCGDPKPQGHHRGNVWPCGFKWASKCPDGVPGGLILKSVKTDRGNRTLPLLPEVVPLLERIRKQQRKDALKAGGRYKLMQVPSGRGKRGADLVFRDEYGQPIDPRQDSRDWHAILERAGLGPTRLHNARHSAAVAMLDSGVAMSELPKLLGHSSSTFSVDVYTQFSKEAADATRAGLDAYHAARRLRAKAKAADVIALSDHAPVPS